MDIIQSALLYAQQMLQLDAGGHDFHHTLRVYRMSMRLARVEGGNLQTIALAAILHDVDDYKLFGSMQGSTQNAKRFLHEEGVGQLLIDAVCEIIGTLSFKGIDSSPCGSLEGRIVQDADRLDAIGAIGIARAFTFGGNRNRIMHDPAILPNLQMDATTYIKNQGTTLNHFYEKLFLLKDQMNTLSAQKIAEHRHTTMHNYVREFLVEWNAEDFETDK